MDNAGSTVGTSQTTHRRKRRVTVENFRPNLVVSSAFPHAEDHWHSIQLPLFSSSALQPQSISSPVEKIVNHAVDTAVDTRKVVSAEMLVTGPCARCTMVDVDSVSGRSECRVFEALGAYRRQRGHGVCFGQFLATQSLTSQTAESEGVNNGDWFLSTGSLITVRHSPAKTDSSG